VRNVRFPRRRLSTPGTVDAGMEWRRIGMLPWYVKKEVKGEIEDPVTG